MLTNHFKEELARVEPSFLFDNWKNVPKKHRFFQVSKWILGEMCLRNADFSKYQNGYLEKCA
jgi:hypothetical protein